MFELLFNFLPPIFEDSNPVVQSKLYIFGIKFFFAFSSFSFNGKNQRPDFNTAFT